MIRELAANGKTVLVSSHILTELAEMCEEVGIIERGQLLAVGKVEEIQREMQPHVKVAVSLLERAAELVQWLHERGDCQEVQSQGNQVSFDFKGTPRDQAGLVRAICAAGFPVLEVGAKQQSLEDLFMQITTGAVQ
jgi:ABC-2 type transport system ATP-binding protein